MSDDIDRLTSVTEDLKALAAKITIPVGMLSPRDRLTILEKKVDDIIDILRQLRV